MYTKIKNWGKLFRIIFKWRLRKIKVAECNNFPVMLPWFSLKLYLFSAGKGQKKPKPIIR